MPDKAAKVAPQPKTQPDPADVARIARLIAASKRPIIVSETSGEDTTAFAALQELADLASIPVVEPGTPTYANFPNNHPLHMGFDIKPHVETCDLFLVVGSSVPWYPPHAGPTNGTVVVIDENPIKGYMTYQNLQADHYLEGNIASSLRLLIEALKAQDPGESSVLQDRRQHWESEHNRIFDGYRSAAAAVKDERPIDPVWLCAAISDVMPENAIYVEETITHRQPIQRHISWSQAQSYFHPSGGLGMGLGQALGVKLAAPERPVLALVGDGSFLYNPIVPALGAAKEIGLPILIVVFNNGNYSAMKGSHLDFYPQGVAANTGIFHGVNISGPDYSTLIQPFGGYGERVEDPAEVKPALERALAAVSSGQTALLDVVLSR
jgi:acetolactate synthase-1/2/3 large subunit